MTSDGITVTQSPNSTVYTSNQLTLTCVTTVSQAVDLPVQVTQQWVGPEGVVTSDNETSVSEVTGSGRDYSSTVVFDYLLSSHSGTYTCSSIITSVVPSVFIVTSDVQTSTQIMISVGKVLNPACASLMVLEGLVHELLAPRTTIEPV